MRKNIIGNKYNRLTVVADVGKRTNEGKVLWQCQCECGNIAYVRSDHLTSGRVKSCGCFNDELKRSRFKDLTGYENKNFKIIERGHLRNQRVYWKCLCKHCGNITFLNSNEIEVTKSCGCLKIGATKEYMASITDHEARKNNRPTKKSTTGIRGVYFIKSRGRYQAFINVNKKSVYLGSSKNIDVAAKMRKDAELKYGYKQEKSNEKDDSTRKSD